MPPNSNYGVCQSSCHIRIFEMSCLSLKCVHYPTSIPTCYIQLKKNHKKAKLNYTYLFIFISICKNHRIGINTKSHTLLENAVITLVVKDLSYQGNVTQKNRYVNWRQKCYAKKVPIKGPAERYEYDVLKELRKNCCFQPLYK